MFVWSETKPKHLETEPKVKWKPSNCSSIYKSLVLEEPPTSFVLPQTKQKGLNLLELN